MDGVFITIQWHYIPTEGMISGFELMTGLVTELFHEWFMEFFEPGDDGGDFILLWKYRAPEVPCSGNLITPLTALILVWGISDIDRICNFHRRYAHLPKPRSRNHNDASCFQKATGIECVRGCLCSFGSFNRLLRQVKTGEQIHRTLCLVACHTF